MKRFLIFKAKWMVFMGAVLLLPLLGGCQDDALPEGEIPLSQIPDNPDYTSLPLIGTPWKLIGFVDEHRKRVKLAEPEGESSFLLTFKENSDLSGLTSTNTAYGKYFLDIDNRLKISQFNHITKINELFDGRYYIESMNNVSSFSLSPKGLKLYYDTQKFMLFKPQ